MLSARLFVAVAITSEIAGSAAALIGRLRQRVDRLAPGAPITWAAPERMHLTLRFIGAATEDQTSAIAAALVAPVPVDPFDLTFAGLGAFPERGRPRVLWVGLTHGRAALLRVEREVGKRLAGLVPADERSFNPHLTLARIRDAAQLSTMPLYQGLEESVLGTTRVDTVTLFNSVLSPKGSTYSPLRSTPLASA